jgi:hypothetical protein
LNAQLTEEIRPIERQIAEADMEKAMLQKLPDFSRSMLVDIPTAWARTSVGQKQRAQNV